MKALILGGGKVGLGIAQHLVEHGIEVVIVDKSPQVVNYVKHFTDLPIVLGDAFDTDNLSALFQSAPTHIISTLSNDEQNFVACKIIGNVFGSSVRIARIRSQIFTKNESMKLFVKDSFNIDTIIQPEIEVANAITDIVSIKDALDVVNLSDIVVISLKCLPDTEVLNTAMNLFESITDFIFRILVISRNGKSFFPAPNDVLLPNDNIYIAIDKKNKDDVLRLFGYTQDSHQTVLIVGGGNIGETVVKKLLEQHSDISITLVEKSRERANEIAQKFPRLMVMFGDVQNPKILQEAGQGIDTAVIATNDDQVNVLTALFFNRNKVPRILALSNNKEYDQLMNADTLSLILDPNVITVNNIVKQSRDINGFETATLLEQSLCVIETKVQESCSYLGRKISELSEKDHIMPMFVVRNGNLMKIKKDYELTLDDTVILLITNDRFTKIEQIFNENLIEGRRLDSILKIFENNPLSRKS